MYTVYRALCIHNVLRANPEIQTNCDVHVDDRGNPEIPISS